MPKSSHKLYIPILPLFLLLCMIQSGCGRQTAEPFSKSGFYFDTVITVTLYDSRQEKLMDECFSLADKYEHMFSTTIADSDISRINQAGGTPVSVSDETIALLKKGIEYGALSEGAFDITIGTLSDLWNIPLKALLDETDASMIPSEVDIANASATVDYHAIKIEGNMVTLQNPDAKIDLGGIAKGFIADEMKTFLLENGVESGIINLGGNVLCIGEKTDKSAYKIGIQMPFSEGENIAAISVRDKSVVTSGIYERYFTVDDVMYHHLLNPKTGYPYDNGLLGVTVITNLSADGDALSTTCFALGAEAGLELIENLPDTEAVFVTADYQLLTSHGIGTEIDFTDLRSK